MVGGCAACIDGLAGMLCRGVCLDAGDAGEPGGKDG
jgi:hypothetical protein